MWNESRNLTKQSIRREGLKIAIKLSFLDGYSIGGTLSSPHVLTNPLSMELDVGHPYLDI